ncbi:hypothetical protein MLD38_024177 [Melastoma candidum]|uniref:Uncharacterized protein n=1 Tax=Melastoma candidum TaxID=119954 RepID=A0ACB9NY89_9MYRT|nr:hypothetical protein MLD38_024177 [Melastoma candidum]
MRDYCTIAPGRRNPGRDRLLPPIREAPGSSNTLFLGGAGFRGIEIPGKFLKVTAIGLYIEDGAVPFLAAKWKGKAAEELAESPEFIHDVVAAPYERFLRVTMLLPLTGVQYSEKVSENCVAYWKSIGKYTDAEAAAIEKFLETFKDETFAPGASILFTQSPDGSTTIGFTNDGTIPEMGKAVITNRQLTDAILESIIGLKGVSPAARQSLASRLWGLMGGGCEGGKVVEGGEQKVECNGINGEAGKAEPVVV